MVSYPKTRPLSQDECRALLAKGGLGRVGVSTGALPAIYSVFFSLVDAHIVLRVSSDWELRKAVDNTVVAFNADGASEDGRSGWSVLVQGIGEEVKDPGLTASYRLLPLAAWGSEGEADGFVRISIDRLSGTCFG